MPLIPPQNLAAGISLGKLDSEATVELETSGFLGLSAKSALVIGIVVVAIIVALVMLSL